MNTLVDAADDATPEIILEKNVTIIQVFTIMIANGSKDYKYWT